VQALENGDRGLMGSIHLSSYSEGAGPRQPGAFVTGSRHDL